MTLAAGSVLAWASIVVAKRREEEERMKSFSGFLAASIVVAFGLTVSDASASPFGTVWWSSIASGCTIDSRYAANAVINSQDGSVSFASGKTGTILLSCPVTVVQPTGLNGACVWMDLISLDPDSHTGTTYKTGAFLNSTPLDSGTAANVTSMYNANFGTFREDDRVNNVGLLDFTQNAYWIDIELDRSSTAANPTFWAVSLSGTTFSCS